MVLARLPALPSFCSLSVLSVCSWSSSPLSPLWSLAVSEPHCVSRQLGLNQPVPLIARSLVDPSHTVAAPAVAGRCMFQPWAHRSCSRSERRPARATVPGQQLSTSAQRIGLQRMPVPRPAATWQPGLGPTCLQSTGFTPWLLESHERARDLDPREPELGGCPHKLGALFPSREVG